MGLFDLEGRQLERGASRARIGLSGAVPPGPSAGRVSLCPRNIAGQVPAEGVRGFARQDDAHFGHRPIIGPCLQQAVDKVESERQLPGLQLDYPDKVCGPLGSTGVRQCEAEEAVRLSVFGANGDRRSIPGHGLVEL